eukprot:TRINITY_DN2757_c0_g1_i1.p1 TRINITY_DN2757_c0_g1~~TRINITY_DN2757_c0_g1_i1.p1  ORF type:complete len:711 (+),score=358.62 TRINITY_DN2757_c0_g1_i1:105-2135(+)
MALVTQETGISQVSAASQDGSVQHQSEQARRRALQANAKRMRAQMEQKSLQCEQLRQQIERKKKEKEELLGDIDDLYEQKRLHEEHVGGLKDRKLFYRIFKELDGDDCGLLSKHGVEKSFPSLSRELEARLFANIPTTFVTTIKRPVHGGCHAADIHGALADRLQVSPDILSVSQPEERGVNVVTQIRLQWHAVPEHMRDTAQDEAEAEERKLQREAYFGALGSERGCDPAAARAKEAELGQVLRGGALGEVGVEVVRVSEETLATFDDFVAKYGVGDFNELPDEIRDAYQRAQQKEEETVLPEEALDRITELEQAIQQQHRQMDAMRKETSLTEQDIKAIDRQIHAVNAELQHIQQVTGYDRSKSKPLTTDFEIQGAQLAELTALLRRLQEEKVKGQQILRKKTQLAEELARELADKKESEERLYQLHNDNKVADRELAALQEEMEELKGEHKKSDRHIVALEGKRDVTAIESLQLDKDFLKGQIAKHSEGRREQDKVIGAQQFRLTQLEQRVAVVEQCLRDLRMWNKVQGKLKDAMAAISEIDEGRQATNLDQIAPPNEMVDVELYELINRDLEAISNSLKLKHIILIEKEATIEATQQKVDELAMSKDADERYYLDEIWRYRDSTDDLQHQIDEQRQRHRMEEQGLKRTIADTRNKALSDAKRAADRERQRQD